MLDELQREIQSLETRSYSVQAELAYIEKYKTPDNWYTLSKPAVREIQEHISPLIRFQKNEDIEENALRFDINIMSLQEQRLRKDPEEELSATRIRRIAEGLFKKRTDESIKPKEPLLRSMMKDEYWSKCNITPTGDRAH